jgi:hypothetical protein
MWGREGKLEDDEASETCNTEGDDLAEYTIHKSSFHLMMSKQNRLTSMQRNSHSSQTRSNNIAVQRKCITYHGPRRYDLVARRVRLSKNGGDGLWTTLSIGQKHPLWGE